MVAAVSSNTTTPNSKVLLQSPAKPKRAPLSPSRNDNSDHLPRRPASKNVTSRYLSSNVITDTTLPSSCSSSSTTSSSNSISTPKARDKSNMSMKTSTRSLSVSFQGESFALPVSKVSKPSTNGNDTRDKKHAPAMLSRSNSLTMRKLSGRLQQGNLMAMSVDFTNEKMKLSGSRTANAIKALRKSLITDSHDSDHIVSLDYAKGAGPRAIVVPARFWKETINLVKRVQPDPVVSPLVKNNKVVRQCKVLDDGPKVSPPNKRAIPISPSVMSNREGSNNTFGNSPSILSFSADSKRGKVGERKLVDAHVLRLLHNKHLQWRFANARVEATMKVQRATAQKSLYNAWVTISKLWISVISKRVEMQQLKQNLKLHTVLKKQMSYLDIWDVTESDHSISLAGATEALKSSSLCLPVLCGAKVDIQSLTDAICSAIDVTQAIETSICSLATEMDHVNSLAYELASAMKVECSLLDQCKDQFSALTLLEVCFSVNCGTVDLLG
ncbi:hypothetical protein CTI12_AA255120 [Artemisia annua]|uniref:QWRF family n=1 Tax=Artemisia annua TaxID=35608 RepID=A0A2U1NKR9_ARTAN|nr:hypothetical protein CTI12_AA255120 [Artemisia annua]